MTGSGCLIAVQGGIRCFGDFTAVHDISLDVASVGLPRKSELGANYSVMIFEFSAEPLR